MAWGWSTQKEEKKDEEVSTDAGSLTEGLTDMANVSAKMQTLLDNARGKFEDEYKDVKLSCTLPALIQLIIQAEAAKPSDSEFSRDILYNKSGSKTQVKAKDLELMDQSLNFADWAYDTNTKELGEKLEGCGYSLLKHEKVEAAGSVGYYIAINPQTKTALIGVKGTSSLSDMITDCCAATSAQTLDNSFVSNDKSLNEIRAHEGILISSIALAKSLKPFVKDLFIPLKYKLYLCGHSLGAGAASLTGVLLRSQYPDLVKRNAVEVWAFACPPVLNHKAAQACSPFITTVVNNTDVVTRASLNNVEVLFKILVEVQAKLVEKGMDPVDISSTKTYLSKLREGSKGDMLFTIDEGFKILRMAQESVGVDDPNHLYVPGNVTILYRKLQDRKKRREEFEAMKEEAKEKKEKFVEKEEIAKQDPLPVYCVHTDGVATPLCMIEIDSDMVNDHLTGSYHMMVDGLKK